ncbi:MAG: glycosyltransferase family 4 protein [Acidimicrobiales bacterium]
MRILVVTNMYPPHSFGGYELSCRDVVERWRRGGHEVEVLTSTVRAPGVVDDGEDPPVRRELSLYWHDHEVQNPAIVTRHGIERRNRGTLLGLLHSFRPDVVSVWAMGAMSFGLLELLARRSVPAVTVVCDEWPIYGPVTDAWLRPLVRRPRLGWLVGVATGLPTRLPPVDELGPSCFVSQHLLAKVRELSPWRFPGASVVYSGVHLEDFPLTVKPDDGWGWRLLFVGRIDPRKGIDTVLHALAKCPESATLEIHGSGDERHRAELEELASSLGIADRVSFAVTPRHELAQVYRRADVLVFPSIWEEPFGLVPLEAMAAGTPVVGTPVGGAAEFLHDDVNCLTFTAGSADALAGALSRLADDPVLRRRLATGGLDTAARFGVDRLAEVLERCHEAAAAGSLECPDG